MNRQSISIPTSRCSVGIGRADITPPVGIYHRFWGAAKEDRATGVHRPLTAGVLLFAPTNAGDGNDLQIYVTLDHCLLRPAEMQEVLDATSRLIEVDAGRMVVSFSHTHSGGHLSRARAELPGGDLIGPYLDALPAIIAAAYRDARTSLQPAVFTYASTICNMGHHRDCWDDDSNQFVCGFNPDVNLDLPVHVVRMADVDGKLLGTLVNYPCHPTTLAWENSLISPDYIGALRDTVENATGVPCLFSLAPCGDIGPTFGFTGDVEVADRNGRQVAHAALSALESMPRSGADFHYTGPVISGATLGVWKYEKQSSPREQQTTRFRHRRWEIKLTRRHDLPSIEQAEQRQKHLANEVDDAMKSGDEAKARDARALLERSRRLLERLRPLGSTDAYSYPLTVMQLGDAFWVAIEGEPYHALQQDLIQRFPGTPLIITALANGSKCSYLPRQADYEKPLYQVDVAMLEAGSLEAITQAAGDQIETWLADN